jgi:hypothetical protein
LVIHLSVSRTLLSVIQLENVPTNSFFDNREFLLLAQDIIVGAQNGFERLSRNGVADIQQDDLPAVSG